MDILSPLSGRFSRVSKAHGLLQFAWKIHSFRETLGSQKFIERSFSFSVVSKKARKKIPFAKVVF
jgi:hypothetical protein